MSTPIGKIIKLRLCQNDAKKKYDMKTFTLILLTEKHLSVGCRDRAQLNLAHLGSEKKNHHSTLTLYYVKVPPCNFCLWWNPLPTG